MNDKQFEIDQLRKDKIIYAIESCAITLSALLIFILAENFLITYREFVQLVSGGGALGYLLYMGIGNFSRLMRVKKLEEECK